MPKILMLTTDQMIDLRILLESDALAADGWEVAILPMPGAAPDHPRVMRAHASLLATKCRALKCNSSAIAIEKPPTPAIDRPAVIKCTDYHSKRRNKRSAAGGR